jgi:hypothetical protein
MAIGQPVPAETGTGDGLVVLSERERRVDVIVREIAIGGLAGVIAGVLVAGVGGRLFMRVAAAIDPSAIGEVTSNGNSIGVITLAGTVGFALFFGLLVGASVGVHWVVVGPWIPWTGAGRALATGVIAAAIGSMFVVRSNERDFRLLEPEAAILTMLIGLIAILGVAVALIDDLLERRSPAASVASARARAVYWAFLAIGLVLTPLAVGAYFNSESPGFRPPADVGLAMLVVGAATLTWWVRRVRDGRTEPPFALLVIARGALLVAVILGGARLAREVSAILANTAA